MSIKPSDIWPANNGLPSLEEIHRYVDGKMTRDEQYSFERQMESSELLAHAVEGLMLERPKNQENIDEINAFIDQKTGKEAKVVSIFSYSNLAIAASILVVISVGILFLLFNPTENPAEQIAVNQSPIEPLQNSDAAPPAASQAEVATEKAKTDDALAYIIDEEIAEPSAPKASVKRRSRKNRASASQPVVVDDLASAPLASAGQAAEAEEMPGVPMDTISFELIAMNMMDTELKTEELEKDKTDRAFEPSDAKELRLSESKSTPAPASSAKSSAGAASPKRKKAESAKDNSIEEKNSQSIYKWDESIIVFIKSGKPNLALMELNIIIEANDHRREPAIWLKAACLLTMHRKKDAREMLRILSETSGIYKEKAVNLLKGLR